MLPIDLAGAGIPRDILLRFSTSLATQGFSLGPQGMLRILLARDLLDRGISPLCPTDRATLLVEPGPDYWIAGPLLLPRRLSCMACLRHWLRTTRLPDAPDRAGDVTPCEPAALRMIAALASQYLAGNPSPYVTDGLVSVAADGRGVVHPIHPVRGCWECGDRIRHGPAEGIRVHCSPLTGIIRHMEIGAAPEGGLYHAAATFFTPPPALGDRVLLRPRHAYGRGATAEEAEISCLAEALERYSIIYRGDEPVVQARFGDLPGAVSPNLILHFSERQFAGRDRWNPAHSEFQNVPVRFDPETAVGWVEAQRIAGGPPAWLPAAHCYMWYAFQPGEPRIALSDSNGCALGRTVEEATLSGLMELVERDAVAIWWYNRLRRPALPPEELEDEPLRSVMATFAAMGRPIQLLDIATDLGIPVVAAIAPHESGTEPFFASSANWSRRAAARKAVWEVCQIWHSVTRRKQCGEELAAWLLTATTLTEPWLVPDGVAPAHADMDSGDAPRGLASAVERLQSAGLDPLVLDLSRNDVALPAVRVVVPGLRHFWARFGAGRLYRTPVRMGWLSEPTQEDALNPICCMI
jgi:thiazole/oxazole-forming peptide maturase SagD family component